MITTGTFTTPNGAKYAAQLCKHFGHKIETGFEGQSGFCQFPFGRAELTADDTALTVIIDLADAADLDRAHDVIDRHLVRFAFREAFTNMTWR